MRDIWSAAQTAKSRYQHHFSFLVVHMRRFPAPWTVEKIPGGFKVYDANGQSLAYVYSRENPNDAQIAGVLTEDEARWIASNIANLPMLLRKGPES
jgi:hypothetical protein